MSRPAPGWYEDPGTHAKGSLRYFDGQGWTTFVVVDGRVRQSPVSADMRPPGRGDLPRADTAPVIVPARPAARREPDVAPAPAETRPAGWYPDPRPRIAGDLRRFDGTAWTDKVKRQGRVIVSTPATDLPHPVGHPRASTDVPCGRNPTRTSVALTSDQASRQIESAEAVERRDDPEQNREAPARPTPSPPTRPTPTVVRVLVGSLLAGAVAFFGGLMFTGGTTEPRPEVNTVRVGAICADGWRSTATGPGACSWHGGVAEWRYRTSRPRTDASDDPATSTPEGLLVFAGVCGVIGAGAAYSEAKDDWDQYRRELAQYRNDTAA